MHIRIQNEYDCFFLRAKNALKGICFRRPFFLFYFFAVYFNYTHSSSSSFLFFIIFLFALHIDTTTLSFIIYLTSLSFK